MDAINLICFVVVLGHATALPTNGPATDNSSVLQDSCASKPCGQICLPSGSNYSCSCDSGFRLAEDIRSCLVDNINDHFMVLHPGLSSNQSDTKVSTTDKEQIRKILLSAYKNPDTLAYDKEQRLLYYWDKQTYSILRSSIDGSGREVYLSDVNVTSMTIDMGARNLYIADQLRKSVLVASLDLANVTHTLSTHDISKKYHLFVDGKLGKLFWREKLQVDKRYIDAIKSSYLDGTVSKTHVPKQDIKNFAIDTRTNMLYWISHSSQHDIEWFNLTNGDNGTVAAPNTPVGANNTKLNLMGVHESLIYVRVFDDETGCNILYGNLTSVRLHSSARLALNYTKVASFPHQSDQMDTGVWLVLPQDLSSYSSACGKNNGGCDQICLPIPTGGRKCLCGNHYNMTTQNNTCLYIPGSENRTRPSFGSTCPKSDFRLKTDECGGMGTFNFTPPTATDNHGPVHVRSSQQKQPPLKLGVGLHEFVYIAVGASTEVSHCIFMVNVTDLECNDSTTYQVTNTIRNLTPNLSDFSETDIPTTDELLPTPGNSTTASNKKMLQPKTSQTSLNNETKPDGNSPSTGGGNALGGGWIALIVLLVLVLIIGSLYGFFRYRKGDPRLRHFLLRKDYESLPLTMQQ